MPTNNAVNDEFPTLNYFGVRPRPPTKQDIFMIIAHHPAIGAYVVCQDESLMEPALFLSAIDAIVEAKEMSLDLKGTHFNVVKAVY